ncbi:unnamed protein product [Sphenostylis stenocarpa]|uniref:Pectinesterase n=1 Tax=Sphenostylis stenocarpa TaxID=92480 RepID=A0AA86W0Y7_9FABA|nr:unnamed protein product [Sphenostylis stenocarpa]
MSEEGGGIKKRVIIIGVATIFLVAMVVAIAFSVNLTDGSDAEEAENHIVASVKAVKTICKPTDYRKECETSLRQEAGNTTDFRELIKIAFNVTMKKMSKGLRKTDLLREVETDPRAKMALSTCKQLMDLSIGEFKRSIDKMGKFNLDNLHNILSSLSVWLSGTITYQETCLDGFKNTTTGAGKKMRDILTSTMHMSSNALAIIEELANTVLDMDGMASGDRQLGENDQHVFSNGEAIPSWVAAADDDDCDDGGVGVRRLLHGSSHKLKANAVVAKDGSEKFKSINQALKMVPKKNKKPFVIHIKEGVYHEYVEVTKTMTRVVMVGDGGNKTRITGNKNSLDGTTTYRTATVGFENSAGPDKHEAVALRVQADKAIFYRCSMDGYQDTLYVHTMRQFFRDCTISGTTDFVFGDAVTVFQNCTFVVRKPLKDQQLIVTAQGRKERHQPSGIVIQGSSIVANHTVKLEKKAYLARPWKSYSRTIFLNNYMEDLIQPEGYTPWQGLRGPSGMNNCFYAEYNNKGPGSNKSERVKWRGIKELTSESASSYSPSIFFHGDDWIKITRIPYYSTTVPRH